MRLSLLGIVVLFGCVGDTAVTSGTDAAADTSVSDSSVTDSATAPDTSVADTSTDAATCLSGAIAWWRGEGNAKDTLSKNDFVVNGSGLTFVAGKVGTAFNMKFDGTTVCNTSTFTTPTAFAVEGWLMPRSTNDEVILTNWAQDGTAGSSWELFKKGLVIGFKSGNGQGMASSAMVQNNFNHVAVTCDGPSGLHIYLNGGVAYSSSSPCVPGVAALQIRMGYPINGISGWGNPYDGLVDEMALYSRALSQAEIVSIFNAESTGAVACREP